MFCLVVPDKDLDFFSEALRNFGETRLQLQVVEESSLLNGSDWSDHQTTFRDGYICQQILKLRSYQLGLAKNYVVVDSDTVFVRPFTLDDFLTHTGAPLTILSEDREMLVDVTYRDFQVPRLKQIDKIYATVGLDSRPFLQVQMNPILKAHVLESLETDLQLTHSQMMNIGAYEYSWYSAWLLKNFPGEVVQSEPWVKTIHTPQQHLLELIRGIEASAISKGYLAVIYNSSWLRQWEDSLGYRLYQICLFLLQSVQRLWRASKSFKKHLM